MQGGFPVTPGTQLVGRNCVAIGRETSLRDARLGDLQKRHAGYWTRPQFHGVSLPVSRSFTSSFTEFHFQFHGVSLPVSRSFTSSHGVSLPRKDERN